MADQENSSEKTFAKFGLPVKSERPEGLTMRVEVIPKKGEHIFALRDAQGDGDIEFPKGVLMFGEPFEEAARRVLHEHLNCTMDRFYLSTIRNRIDTDGHWHLTIVVVADIAAPKAPTGKLLSSFTESTVLPGLLGWTAVELRDVLEL